MAEIGDVTTDRHMVDSGALVPHADPRAGAPPTGSRPLAIEGVDQDGAAHAVRPRRALYGEAAPSACDRVAGRVS